MRAQQFEGSRSFAHFILLGLVSAGRDTGSGSFEHTSVRQHLDADVEVADGGLVTWTRALLSNNKERLMISGLSLERLAVLDAEP